MIWNSVRMAAYFNNFLTNTKPRKLDDGSYIMDYPMEGKPVYAMDVDDLGGCVASIIFSFLYSISQLDNYYFKMYSDIYGEEKTMFMAIAQHPQNILKAGLHSRLKHFELECNTRTLFARCLQ